MDGSLSCWKPTESGDRWSVLRMVTSHEWHTVPILAHLSLHLQCFSQKISIIMCIHVCRCTNVSWSSGRESLQAHHHSPVSCMVWELPFNTMKCKVLHVGKSNPNKEHLRHQRGPASFHQARKRPWTWSSTRNSISINLSPQQLKELTRFLGSWGSFGTD